MSYIDQLLRICKCSLLIFETDKVEGVYVHRMILKLNSQYINHKDYLGVSQEWVWAFVAFLE